MELRFYIPMLYYKVQIFCEYTMFVLQKKQFGLFNN